MRSPAILPLLLLVAGSATALRGQSAQPFSLQASPLWTVQSFGTTNVGGLGVEVQGRWNPGVLSLGVGYQYSSHSSGGDDLTLSGGFVEPRYAIDVGSSRVAPYIAGRVALLRQTNNFGSGSGGFAVGAGAGLIIALTPRVNVDAGAAVIRQSLDDADARGGGRVDFQPFTGYVAKVGISVGFGRRSL
jgi:hypothetical protein